MIQSPRVGIFITQEGDWSQPLHFPSIFWGMLIPTGFAFRDWDLPARQLGITSIFNQQYRGLNHRKWRIAGYNGQFGQIIELNGPLYHFPQQLVYQRAACRCASVILMRPSIFDKYYQYQYNVSLREYSGDGLKPSTYKQVRRLIRRYMMGDRISNSVVLGFAMETWYLCFFWTCP